MLDALKQWITDRLPSGLTQPPPTLAPERPELTRDADRALDRAHAVVDRWSEHVRDSWRRVDRHAH